LVSPLNPFRFQKHQRTKTNLYLFDLYKPTNYKSLTKDVWKHQRNPTTLTRKPLRGYKIVSNYKSSKALVLTIVDSTELIGSSAKLSQRLPLAGSYAILQQIMKNKLFLRKEKVSQNLSHRKCEKDTPCIFNITCVFLNLKCKKKMEA
jgi:hypothetical protein